MNKTSDSNRRLINGPLGAPQMRWEHVLMLLPRIIFIWTKIPLPVASDCNHVDLVYQNVFILVSFLPQTWTETLTYMRRHRARKEWATTDKRPDAAQPTSHSHVQTSTTCSRQLSHTLQNSWQIFEIYIHHELTNLNIQRQLVGFYHVGHQSGKAVADI